MGVFSEMAIDSRHETDPFAEDIDIPAFTEDDTVQSAGMTTPDVGRTLQDTTLPPAPTAFGQNNGAAPSDAPSVAEKTEETGKDKAAEEEKRRAHEEAEAKRKAEWEARQKAKKDAEQAQIDRLAAMSDDEVMASSMKRVSADTEKLTRRNMKECVAEYVQTMCLEDPAFARKTMHPRKSMIRCFQYIRRKVWDYVQDELKVSGFQPGSGQQVYESDIPDDLCYQWAVDYFNDPDAKEDHEEEEKFVPKPYYGGGTSRTKKNAKANATDKKASAPPKVEAKSPSEDLGQLTLGDFAMPEEKAG